MGKENIVEFIKFRKQFTKLEWQELQHAVDTQLKRKADKLELDDSDIDAIQNLILANRPTKLEIKVGGQLLSESSFKPDK